MGKWASGKVGRWASGQVGNWESGQVGKWESGQVGKWASGKVGKWESGQPKKLMFVFKVRVKPRPNVIKLFTDVNYNNKLERPLGTNASLLPTFVNYGYKNVCNKGSPLVLLTTEQHRPNGR